MDDPLILLATRQYDPGFHPGYVLNIFTTVTKENIMTDNTIIRQNRLDRKTPLVRCYPLQWVSWFLTLMLTLWAVPAQGEEFRYRYVPFGVPPGFDFFDPQRSTTVARFPGRAQQMRRGIVFYSCRDI